VFVRQRLLHQGDDFYLILLGFGFVTYLDGRFLFYLALGEGMVMLTDRCS